MALSITQTAVDVREETWCFVPVGCQSGGYVTPWDLGNDVTPEKRAVDHPYGLGVPVKLRFLQENTTSQRMEIKQDKILFSSICVFVRSRGYNVYFEAKD